MTTLTITEFLGARLVEDLDRIRATESGFSLYMGVARAEQNRRAVKFLGESDPQVRALATIYADHEDFREEWRA
jgi:hypothetical protein